MNATISLLYISIYLRLLPGPINVKKANGKNWSLRPHEDVGRLAVGRLDVGRQVLSSLSMLPQTARRPKFFTICGPSIPQKEPLPKNNDDIGANVRIQSDS
jgi:hypothetical protein